MKLANQRHLFDMPDQITYLDCAYMSPLPRTSLAAGTDGLFAKARPWTLGSDRFFDQGEKLRALIAKLVQADAEDFALIPSVSYGMAVIAKNIQVQKGQEILVLDRQFPSNIYPWKQLAGENSANLRKLPAPNNGDWTSSVLQAIDENTALIALPAVHWIDGGALGLKQIGEAARKVGAKLVLDLTQSLGAMPFCVPEIQPDFFVVANYKWMLGPYTTGFLYAVKSHQKGMPLEQCWQSRKGAENFADLTNYTDQFGAGATRYDMGERSNFAALPAVEASLHQILNWGVDNIYESVSDITGQLAKIAQSHGLISQNSDHRAAHYLSLTLPKSAPETFLQTARENQVFFSQRGDRLRITPHLWVNENDLDRFDQVIAKCLKG